MIIQRIHAEVTCPACYGEGVLEAEQIAEERCQTCQGSGLVSVDLPLSVLAYDLEQLPDETLASLAERLLRVLGLGALIDQAREREAEEAIGRAEAAR